MSEIWLFTPNYVFDNMVTGCPLQIKNHALSVSHGIIFVYMECLWLYEGSNDDTDEQQKQYSIGI